ncbi:GW domain-containing glycosaminoglycan-binding protein [Listeria booriae]|uniref:GW domain-containing glycosaminoglycan-binding protein n=2 Tax=Listeria booriae TaxID=1552123 RepID=UPI00162AC0D2|nr:GW domain-containing glycosaminoglycan-binding protein [Listeria booriae]MBC1248124.1 GW domain-containing glycosaminoglycan-binding protein [Listeria booriae]MBC1287303.1 GW domain-containing glycosaminoglycan-binding protein [Listeria booriae]
MGKKEVLQKLIVLMMILGLGVVLRSEVAIGVERITSNKTIYEYGFVYQNRNAAVYSQPYGTSTAKYITNIHQYDKKDLKLVNRATTKRSTYYRFAVDGKIIGWVDARAVGRFYHSKMESIWKYEKTMYMNQADGIYLRPYSDPYAKVGTTNQYIGKKVTIDRQAVVRGWWYNRLKVNGKVIGWIKSKNLSKDNKQVIYSMENVTKYGKIKIDNGIIYSAASDLYHAKAVAKTNSMYQKDVRILKEARVYSGLWYQISFQGVYQGWIPASAIQITFTQSMEKKVTGQKQVKNPSAHVYQLPIQDAVLDRGNLSAYENKIVEIDREVSVLGETWYRLFYRKHDGTRWVNPTIGFVKAKDVENLTDYASKFQLQMNIPNKENQQGMTYQNGIYYVAFDNKTSSRIIAYDKNGTEVGRTKDMQIGHASELSYYNGKLYVSNGGLVDAKVYVVNFENSFIERTLDLSKYGRSAGITVVDGNTLLLHTAYDAYASNTFTFLDMNGNKKSAFTKQNIGVAQGIAFQFGKIYFYTNNYITIMDREGHVMDRRWLSFKGESQGIDFTENGKIIVGYNGNNRIYQEK